MSRSPSCPACRMCGFPGGRTARLTLTTVSIMLPGFICQLDLSWARRSTLNDHYNKPWYHMGAMVSHITYRQILLQNLYLWCHSVLKHLAKYLSWSSKIMCDDRLNGIEITTIEGYFNQKILFSHTISKVSTDWLALLGAKSYARTLITKILKNLHNWN